MIEISNPSLVLLIGPSGSGKSTFARRHFRNTEVLSSDFCRALVSDDENDQTATHDAFELLHLILHKRLHRRRTTVIDATNVHPMSRASLLAAAKQSDVPAVAIVFQLPEDVCQRRNRQRSYRKVPADVIQTQLAMLAESIASLGSEGFAAIHTFTTEAEADTITVIRR
jgi:protein phosphatase